MILFLLQSHSIEEIVFKKWPAEHILPSDAESMLQLIEEVDSRARQCEPVLIQCL